MSLCRYLPTPSDRMGILWSLGAIEDCVVLEYGPAGTTHYSIGFFGNLNVDNPNRLFTTHMSEDDVVMGDVKRLEDAIIEIDEAFAPKVIVVIASSTSAVIGSDMKGVCSYMQKEVNAKLIAFENGGFKGDYSAGLCQVYKSLAVEFAKDNVEVIEQTYNIIGASMGDYRISSDIHELKRLMKESFDYNIHTALCLDSSIDALSKMSSVKLNIVISYEGIATAEYLKEKFGTPYIYALPYGYKSTLEWLESISTIIGKDINENVISELQTKIAEYQSRPVGMGMFRKIQPKACIYGNYTKLIELSKFLESLGITVEHKICSHSLKNVSDVDESIEYIPNEKERIDILESLKDTLVFADDITKTLLDTSNKYIRFSAPLINAPQITNRMPFVGVLGADFIKEQFDEYINSLV